MRFGRLFLGCLALGLLSGPWACSVRPKEDLRKQQRSSALNLIEEAESYSDKGLYQQAVQRYLKALDLSPSPQVYYGLGHCYSRLQEYDTAVLYLQKAVEAAPDFSLAYYELLNAEEMRNSSDRALALGGAQGPGPRDYAPAPQGGATAQSPKPPSQAQAPKAEAPKARNDSETRPLSLASADEFRPRPLRPPPPGAKAQSVRMAPKIGQGQSPAAEPGPPAAQRAAIAPPEAPYGPAAEESETGLKPGEAPAPRAQTPPPVFVPPVQRILPPAEEPSRWGVPAEKPLPPSGVPPAEERPAEPPAAAEQPPSEKGAGLSRAYEVLFGKKEQKEKPAVELPRREIGPTLLGDAQFHVDKADDFMVRSEYRKAVDEYIEALRRNDRDATVRTRLGSAYLQLGENEKAEEQVRRAVELDPNNFEAVFRMAEIQFNAKQYSEALSLAERATSIDPQNAEALLLLGDISARLEREARAEALYNRAHELQPESPRPFWKLGNLNLQVKDYTRAREFYQRALDVDPKFVPVHNNLGFLAQMEGQFEESKQHFEKAIELDPKWAKAYKNLGILYEKHLNNPKEAIKCYEKYIKLGGPDGAEVRGWIAQIRSRM